jgi:hypothetical protein
MHESTTSCIVHLAYGANLKGVTSNKLCIGLTGSCFESPNDTIHVTVMAQFEKKSSVVQKSNN